MEKFSMLQTQNLLRATNPETFSSIRQILLKISFLKGKNNSFEKTNYELTVTEILKIELWYLSVKIQILVKKKIRFLFPEFREYPRLN